MNHDAMIDAGGVLYRIASINFNGRDQVLTGNGTASRSQPGRFNHSQQRASYCSTNVLTSLSEVLFHMYRGLLTSIEKGDVPLKAQAWLHRRASLAVMHMKGIDRLVNLDAQQVGFVFNRRICGTAAVHPDQCYGMFHEFHEKLRSEDYRGIVYPSARHSAGHCLVLFRDESAAIEPGTFRTVDLELYLIREDHDFAAAPALFDPYSFRVHPTLGYYFFPDQTALDEARSAGALYPATIPRGGYVDFVRRRYAVYPGHATMHAV